MTRTLIRNLQGDSGKSNWSVSISYNKHLKKTLFLKAGVGVASLGYQGIKQTGLRWPSEIDSNFVYTPDPTLPHEIQTIYDQVFVEVPVVLRHEFAKRLPGFFIEAGIAPSVYITTQTKQITELADSPIRNSSRWPDYRLFQLTGKVALGFNYQVNQNVQLCLQSKFDYQLLNSTHFTTGYHLVTQYGLPVIKEHLYAAGVEIGVRKALN